MAAASSDLLVASNVSASKRTLRRRRLRRQRTRIGRETLLSYCPPRFADRTSPHTVHANSKVDEQPVSDTMFTIKQLGFLRQLMEKALSGFGQVLCGEIETISSRVDDLTATMLQLTTRLDEQLGPQYVRHSDANASATSVTSVRFRAALGWASGSGSIAVSFRLNAAT